MKESVSGLITQTFFSASKNEVAEVEPHLPLFLNLPFQIQWLCNRRFPEKNSFGYMFYVSNINWKELFSFEDTGVWELCLKIRLLMEHADWNCCLGNLKLLLCLLRGQGNEAEEIVGEGCQCTVMPQKGRCHLATVTGCKRELIQQRRAAWLLHDALLRISDKFYSCIGSVGQCEYTICKVTKELQN